MDKHHHKTDNTCKDKINKTSTYNHKDKTDKLNIKENHNIKLKTIHTKTKIKDLEDNKQPEEQTNKEDKTQHNNNNLDNQHLNLLHKI